MKPSRSLAALAACAALALGINIFAEDAKPAKTNDVKVKDITLAVPETWEQQEPGNKLRLAQFVIPAGEGEKGTSELVVSSFGGGGGGIDQNLPRWTNEFKKDTLAVKLTQGKSKHGDYQLADLTGTHVGTTFAPRPKPLEDARMLAIVLNVEGKGIYYLKLVGPKKSVTAAADAFRTSIGATTKDEKEYKSEKSE